MTSVEKLARLAQGELLRGSGATPHRVIHDSRLVQPGDLFIALVGAHVDGHQFLDDAFARGACAALVSDADQLPETAHDVILVPDCLAALHAWAKERRRRLECTRIGITGTNGKTTVKRILQHLLSARFPTYASPRNYNTEIGLPLALLETPDRAEFGVFELGTEHPGDIHLLADILRPTWAVITSVGPGHLDGLRSVEHVASEKWSLAEALPETGTVIIPADSPHLVRRSAGARCSVVTVGLGQGDVQARLLRTAPKVQLRLEEEGVVLECPLLGDHNASNLLLAAVAANRLGVDWPTLAAQAAGILPAPHRLQPIVASFGHLLDDTYNANPSSMKAALRVLCDVDPHARMRVFVFGQMCGLGAQEASYHREILAYALALPVDVVLPVGAAPVAVCEDADPSRVMILPRHEISAFLSRVGPNAVVLIKGSRELQMETLVHDLVGRQGGGSLNPRS